MRTTTSWWATTTACSAACRCSRATTSARSSCRSPPRSRSCAASWSRWDGSEPTTNPGAAPVRRSPQEPSMSNVLFVRRRLIAAAAAAGALALAAPAWAQAPIVIKFSHVVAIDTPKGKAAEFFAKRAGELTKGKVKVEVYANSALYKDKEELEALQLGAVQMLAPSLAKFGPLGVKEFEVFDFPYLFDDTAELHKVTQGPVGQTILKKLDAKGIHGLAYWDNGFKSFSANTPIRTPADLKGKKMRIQSSKVLEEQMRALGAIPQVMAFSEVYQALQTG